MEVCRAVSVLDEDVGGQEVVLSEALVLRDAEMVSSEALALHDAGAQEAVLSEVLVFS